ncbi:MAG TPA: hypothetical protein PKA06_14340 [Gemmatales bacterium]|nr:hypothetical protein [Gemmatales bacterium]
MVNLQAGQRICWPGFTWSGSVKLCWQAAQETTRGMHGPLFSRADSPQITEATVREQARYSDLE